MINRTILDKVCKCIKTKPITIITGARQVGKSTLCKELVKLYGYNYVSLDNTRELETAKNDPAMFLKLHHAPLIIDEIQKCKELFTEMESIVNDARFNDTDNRGMYVLTGSQSYNLMQNVTETMAGRVAIVTMSPLSRREILGIKETPFELDPITCNSQANKYPLEIDELVKNIVKGFYPEIYDLNIGDTDQFYSDYVQTYIERDVSQLINLKDKLQFQRFLEVLASLTGEELIYDTLAKAVGVTVKTVESWISVLSAGNIITLLEPYYEDSVVKRIVKRPKLLFNDTGLAAYLSGLNNDVVLKKSAFLGRFVETYIINEVIKSYRNNGIQARFYYYRDFDQREIDLIVLHNGYLNLLECKTGVTFNHSDIRAFDQLIKTKYEICNSGIICNTDVSYNLKDGFYAVPVSSI